MVKEVLLKLESKDTWLAHLLEHCIVRVLEDGIRGTFLERQGIIIDASTSFGVASVEIYYTDDEVEDAILQMIGNLDVKITNSLIEEERKRLNREIEYIDIDDETIFLYEGLKYSEKVDVLDMYRVSTKNSISTIRNKLIQIIQNSLLILKVDEKLIYPIKYANYDLVCNKSINKVFLSKNENFISFDMKYTLKSMKEYIILSILTFVLGMTEESLIEKEYLQKSGKYLGYTQAIIVNGNYHILGLVDSEGEHIDNLVELFNRVNFIDWSEDYLKKYIMAFKTYFELNNTSFSLSKELIKTNIVEEKIDLASFSCLIDTVSKEDLQNMFNKLKGDGYVKKVC